MWRAATSIWRRGRWFSPATVSAQELPIQWKWCNRKSPSPARTNNTSRVYTAIITRKFPWFVLSASLSRASRNFSEENEHGGRKPTSSTARDILGRPIVLDRQRSHTCGAAKPQAPQKHHYSGCHPGGAYWRPVLVALLEQL